MKFLMEKTYFFIAEGLSHVVSAVFCSDKIKSSPCPHFIISYLRWFGHVWRRPVESPIRRIDQMEGSPVAKGRERPRKTT